MRIYRLIPVAEPDDPNWSLSPCRGEVIVRAKSSGDARIVATTAENDFAENGVRPDDGTTDASASAFRNEKLYTVIEDISGRYSGEGPRAVLSGAFDHRVILPLVARDQ